LQNSRQTSPKQQGKQTWLSEGGYFSKLKQLTLLQAAPKKQLPETKLLTLSS